VEERLVLARGDLRRETAPDDRQRKSALHLVARAYEPRADDTHRRIEREVRVARVLLRVEMVCAFVAVADLAQADGPRHVLRLVLARGALRRETAPVDRQRESALHLVARADAPRADDALRRIEREVRVARVLLRVEMVRAFIAVADLAQADGPRHVLHLVVAV